MHKCYILSFVNYVSNSRCHPALAPAGQTAFLFPLLSAVHWLLQAAGYSLEGGRILSGQRCLVQERCHFVHITFRFSAVDKVATCFHCLVEVSASRYFAPLWFAMGKDTWVCKQVHILCGLDTDLFLTMRSMAAIMSGVRSTGTILHLSPRISTLSKCFASFLSNSVRHIVMTGFNSVQFRAVKAWSSFLKLPLVFFC